jgi:hypothetical protein
LTLCERGEWLVLEQRLRNVEKTSPVLSQADPEVCGGLRVDIFSQG